MDVRPTLGVMTQGGAGAPGAGPRLQRGRLKERTMKTGILIGLLLAAGCGAGLAPEGAPAVVGLWEAQQSCVSTFDFRADSTYAQAMACPIGDGSGNVLGVQLEAGTYAADAGTLTLTTLDATCPGWSKTSSIGYVVMPGRLDLSDQSATVTLVPATETAGTGSGAALGCFFDANGVSQPFQPSPLAPL